jgi:hypothetical protein
MGFLMLSGARCRDALAGSSVPLLARPFKTLNQTLQVEFGDFLIGLLNQIPSFSILRSLTFLPLAMGLSEKAGVLAVTRLLALVISLIPFSCSPLL